MPIQEVEIENYKCLEYFKFKPARINILVGRNNSGKSSVLEAIGLTTSVLNNFTDSVDSDLIETILENRETFARYLINAKSNKSQILLNLDGDHLKLELEFLKKGYPNLNSGEYFLNFVEHFASEIALEEINKELLKLRRKIKEPVDMRSDKLYEFLESKKRDITDKIINSQKLFFMGSLNNAIISEVVYFTDYVEYIIDDKVNIYSKDVKRIPLVFSTGRKARLFDIENLYNVLIQKNRLFKALDILRVNVEDFDDLREFEGEIVCMLQNIDKPIPVSFMGDGFIALVKMVFMQELAKDGVAILEEPETNLHPGYLNVVADQILENKNIQFFVSTHSIELLNYLVNYKEFLEEIKFIRMYRYGDGSIGWEVLSGEDAKYEIEKIKADLRGI